MLGSFAAVLIGDQGAIRTLTVAAPRLQRDIPVFFVFAVAMFCVNWGTRVLLVEPMLAISKVKVHKAKFKTSVLEVVIYGVFTFFGLRIVPSQDFVWPSAKWWIGYVDGGHEVMRADMRCYYILYMSRYAQSIVSVFIEPRRKDFVEMLIHHSATIFVTFISYLYGWNRIGVVVMVLLDPADVPLHAAKLFKYMHDATARPSCLFLANRLFELFVVVFFVTRLVMFSYVCWSAHIEATRYMPGSAAQWACVALLYTLLALQVYWFSLVIKVILKILSGVAGDDPRSDDEGEQEEEERKTK